MPSSRPLRRRRGYGPSHPRNLVGKRDRSDFCRAPTNNAVSQGRCPGTTDLGVADDGKCTDHEQAAQIAAPCLLMLPSRSLPPLECCFGTSPIQAEKLRPDRKLLVGNNIQQFGDTSAPERGDNAELGEMRSD